jgi:hypothetical protein
MGFQQRLIGEESSLLQQWLNYDDKGSSNKLKNVQG